MELAMADKDGTGFAGPDTAATIKHLAEAGHKPKDRDDSFQKVYAHRLDPEGTSEAVADKMNSLFSKRRKVA
jgi:hypothetical protein